MKKTYWIMIGVFVALTLILGNHGLAQSSPALTQVVRGKITDIDSQEELIGATIQVVGSNPIIGTTTDIQGNFRLNEVPLGRVSLKVDYIGYESQTLPNIVVTSGKEVILNIRMQESALRLQEVVVTANDAHGEPINEMALVSSRAISIEEMSRMTAGFNDPALITTNFAGVANSGDGGNDIIVRGNSPKYMQWRLEGMPITNPNHFADQNAVSGTTSALNSNLLATSDFYTGAFTAEYGNALSGVYDIKFRSGNNEKRETIIGAGLLGTDLTLEGPFKKGYNGSYLVNYRYSTASVLDQLGLLEVDGNPVFQDAAFKVNLPTKKAGTFSVFGLGAMSKFSQKDITPQDWVTPGNDGLREDVKEDYEKSAYLANIGITHVYSFGRHNFLESRVGFSADGIEDMAFLEGESTNRRKSFDGDLNRMRYQGQVDYHHKLNARNKLQAGGIFTHQQVKNYQARFPFNATSNIVNVDFDEGISSFRSYVSWKHRINDELTVVAGLHNTNVFLNDKSTVEPRLTASWKASRKSTFNIGYGMHSAMEQVHHYFARISDANGNTSQPNKELDLLKAHHLVAGYTYQAASNLQVRLEAYYQHLYNLPVSSVDTSHFATINEDVEFEYQPLVNEGSGENYGIELTIQKFFSDQYYFMVNGSVYQSKYKSLEGVTRNTRYNGNYLFNLLGGKEFGGLGRKNNQTLGINARVFIGGGKKILPVLRDANGQAAVNLDEDEVWDYANAYKNSIEDIYQLTLSASYKWEKAHATHELFLNLDNLTDRKGRLTEFYDANQPNGIGYTTQFGLIPNLMYKIYF